MSPTSRGTVRAAASVGAIGIALFVLCSWLLPFATRFGVSKNQISALVSGRFGYLQTAAFLAGAVGTLLVAMVLRLMIRRSAASTIAVTLLVIAGGCLLLVAIFPTDITGHPNTFIYRDPGDIVHVASTLLGMTCSVIAVLAYGAIFRSTAAWQPLTGWSLLLAGCAVSGLVVRLLGYGDGLVERLIVTALAGWMIMAAVRASRLLRLPPPNPPVDAG